MQGSGRDRLARITVAHGAGKRQQPVDIFMKTTRPPSAEDLAAVARARIGLAFGADRLKALAAELERYDRTLTDAGWPGIDADPARDYRLRLKRARRP